MQRDNVFGSGIPYLCQNVSAAMHMFTYKWCENILLIQLIIVKNILCD